MASSSKSQGVIGCCPLPARSSCPHSGFLGDPEAKPCQCPETPGAGRLAVLTCSLQLPRARHVPERQSDGASCEGEVLAVTSGASIAGWAKFLPRGWSPVSSEVGQIGFEVWLSLWLGAWQQANYSEFQFSLGEKVPTLFAYFMELL